MFLIFLLLAGVLLYGIYNLVSKVSVLSQKSINIKYSPLEDNIYVKNSAECFDSDEGIFFTKKGEVSYEFKFIFLRFNDKVSDECNGNELTEYYCSDNNIVRGIVLCPNKCDDGACLV